MKNVLYIGGFNLPDRNAAAQRVIANSKILSKLGYVVTLVGLDKEKSEFEYGGFKCINLKYPSNLAEWYRYLFTIDNYVPYLKSIEPQMVIAYNHPAKALEKLLNYDKKKGIKTISDCTEWYEPEGNWLFRKVKGWDTNKRMKEVHCNLDGIITISRYLDDFYGSKGVRTLLLPPLVDKSDEKWNESLNKTNDGIVRLVFAGSTAGTKDRIDFVLETLDKIANEGCVFALDVIGITEQMYQDAYKKNIPQSISSYTRFLGRLPHREVIRKIRESDFQIFLRENHLANKAGFPTKFSETISAGAIVLTNSSSNLKDYMVEGVNSFELDITDSESLVRTLRKPLSLSKTQIRSIKASIDSNLFDYHGYITRTEKFLDSL